MCWQCREQPLPSSLISFTRRPNTRTVIGWGELVTIPEHLVGYGAVFGSDNHNHNQPPLQCSILRISLTLFEILFWEFVHFYNVWTTVVWLVETRSEWRPEQNCPHCPHLAPAATRELTGRRVWTRMAAVEYWSETLLPAKLNNWQRIDQRIIAPRCAALVWPGIMDTTLSIFTSISVSILCPWFNNINEMCKEEHEKVIRHEIQIPGHSSS